MTHGYIPDGAFNGLNGLFVAEAFLVAGTRVYWYKRAAVEQVAFARGVWEDDATYTLMEAYDEPIRRAQRPR